MQRVISSIGRTCWLGLVLGACGGIDPSAEGSSEPPEPEAGPMSGNGPSLPDPPSGAGGMGGVGGAGDGPGEPMPEPYLPLAEGRSWTYDVTDNGVVTRKITTVGAEEAVGGNGPNSELRAFKVTTEKNDGTEETVSWQTRLGDLAIRYREQAFGAGGLELEEHWAPYKLRLDESVERAVAGTTWQEVFEETKLEVNLAPVTASRVEVWTVLAVDEPVTVPAGTFDCLVVQKASASSAKMYWFARGVGKVMETGGQTEELREYTVP